MCRPLAAKWVVRLTLTVRHWVVNLTNPANMGGMVNETSQLGSLVGQLAESDPEARALIAAGFDQ